MNPQTPAPLHKTVAGKQEQRTTFATWPGPPESNSEEDAATTGAALPDSSSYHAILKEAIKNAERWPPTRMHWPEMSLNDVVSVSRDGHILYEGVVEDRTDDGTVVWIRRKNGYRQLLHIDDGFHLSEVPA